MLFSDGFIFLLDNAIIYAVTVTVCSIAYRGVLLFNFNVDRYSCTDTVVICNKDFFFHIIDSHRNSADLCRLLFRRALPTRKPTVENSVYSIDKKKEKTDEKSSKTLRLPVVAHSQTNSDRRGGACFIFIIPEMNEFHDRNSSDGIRIIKARRIVI